MKSKILPVVLSVGLILALAGSVSLTRAQGPNPPLPTGSQPGGEPQAAVSNAPSAALGTAFTYQGRLEKGGNPVNDTCDFQFSLWDDGSGGVQIGLTQTRTGVQVSDGLFTIADLDFGADAFHGDARWLQIAVRCTGDAAYTTLSPRQALTAAPYALSLRPGAVISGTQPGANILTVRNNAATGGAISGHGPNAVIGISNSPGYAAVFGRSDSPQGYGVYGWAPAASGNAYGVYGRSDSVGGAGVYGVGRYGVFGRTNSADGYGVVGWASAASGLTRGVYGESDSSEGTGVYGLVDAGSGVTRGVYGESTSTEGRGVVGVASAASGHTYGVAGESASIEGIGVHGWATAASGPAYGVGGQSDSTEGIGVIGYASAITGTTYGVYGWSDSTSGRGVYGVVPAASGHTYGVYGESASTEGLGVHGWATAASGTTFGVGGQSDSTEGTGVVGYASAASGTTYGVQGWSDSVNGRGVYGRASADSGSNYGVYGESASDNGVGVYGTSPLYGVYGYSNDSSGIGVYGRADALSGNTYGVYGYTASPHGRAVYGYSSNASGYAGYFLGNVHVQGNLSVSGAKPFRIDHPLDPANRYLYHFAQEAPEVQNVYNGVVTLNARGEATVNLPAYFSALNTGPFRYQLTAIGAPMPNLYIAQEIQGNTFRIAGGVPGKKVSWEVTAVRNDPYLRDHPVQAEVDKPAGEQGTYLYPEGYGQPPEKGLDYQSNVGLFGQTPAGWPENGR